MLITCVQTASSYGKTRIFNIELKAICLGMSNIDMLNNGIYVHSERRSRLVHVARSSYKDDPDPGLDSRIYWKILYHIEI